MVVETNALLHFAILLNLDNKYAATVAFEHSQIFFRLQ